MSHGDPQLKNHPTIIVCKSHKSFCGEGYGAPQVKGGFEGYGAPQVKGGFEGYGVPQVRGGFLRKIRCRSPLSTTPVLQCTEFVVTRAHQRVDTRSS